MLGAKTVTLRRPLLNTLLNFTEAFTYSKKLLINTTVKSKYKNHNIK